MLKYNLESGQQNTYGTYSSSPSEQVLGLREKLEGLLTNLGIQIYWQRVKNRFGIGTK